MLAVDQKAAEIWKDMSENEKTGVRFGIFPAVKMFDAEWEGYNGQELCVALMDQAKADGGMHA